MESSEVGQRSLAELAYNGSCPVCKSVLSLSGKSHASYSSSGPRKCSSIVPTKKREQLSIEIMCFCILGQGYMEIIREEPGHVRRLKGKLGTKNLQVSEYTVYSNNCEAVVKLEQLSQEHQAENTNKSVKGNNTKKNQSEIQRSHVERHNDVIPEHCFWGSSLCYGGPDEQYDTSQARKEVQNELEIKVKQLEEAMDPFNLECTTRGNWWQGMAAT
eukprot:Gb_40689 [translate_table: standard]